MPKIADSPKQTRSDRRRAETRARLLAAARELFAEQGVGGTRTGDITERADVAAGSLYNHFSDKDEIVETLLTEITEEQGALVDELTREIEDPAAVVSYAHRHFVRLALRDRGFGQLMIRLDASHRLMARILGPLATRDIETGVKAGRFDVDDVPAAVYISGGALLGTIAGIVDGINADEIDQTHAAAVLRMLGLDPEDANAVSLLSMDGAPDA
jgi:AcrR family transcriptional regulator